MWAKAACGLPSVEWSDGILGERPELTVRPSDDDHIAVWLTKPELQMICERVDLDRIEYLSPCLNRTLIVLLDMFGHEPQDDAISVGLRLWTTKVQVFMGIPVVQLQYQHLIGHELLVLGTAVRADEPEGALKPNAGLLHIGDTDERLREHGSDP
jgi:hypothetical protein